MDFIYSSSSDIIPIPPQHQVFINFRGEELREGFLEILVQALKEEQVNVFVDEDEVRGEDLNVLFDRIKKSKIAITIFSEKYTESKWCLNELVEIEECMNHGRLHVIPIFFNVKAEDVKNLRGNFGDNFRKLKKKYPKKSEKPAKWKKAFISISEKFGLSANLRFCYYLVPFLYLSQNKTCNLQNKKLTKLIDHLIFATVVTGIREACFLFYLVICIMNISRSQSSRRLREC